MTQNYILRGGDVLAVPDNRFNSVFLLGEFENNAQVTIPQFDFFSLADAFANANIGGFSQYVDSGRIFVFRYRDTEKKDPRYDLPVVYHLNASSADSMLLAANFPLLPRDIVYAAPTGLTRWNRVVEQILPSIEAVYLPIRTYWLIEDISTSDRTTSDRRR
jgi:polysaccharide export outer membrane protein